MTTNYVRFLSMTSFLTNLEEVSTNWLQHTAF